MQATQANVIQRFFGYHPADPAKSGMTITQVKALPYDEGVGAGGIKGFAVELGRLSSDEKLELARGRGQGARPQAGGGRLPHRVGGGSVN